MPRAAILSIGDELTLGQNVDTNSAYLSARLTESAILPTEHRTVADDRAAIASAIRELCAGNDVLIITGGLGPTDDDLTRDALGDVLTPGKPLVNDPASLELLQRWFERRGRGMPTSNLRQAFRPDNARSLANPNGTAPGIAGELHLTDPNRNCLIFSLPGPPREMQPMFQNFVLAALRERGLVRDDHVLLTACVQEFGMGESPAAQKLGDMMHRDRDPLVGTTASESIVTARIRTAGSPDEARARIDQAVLEIERAWHPYAFGRGETSLAQSLGEMLNQSRQTLAVAESCTGGLLGKLIVDVAGSSQWFKGGWIAYSNEMKSAHLGVDPDLIVSHGAVSPEVAMAMAEGALREARSDWALSITGVAGPDGGTPHKPVGTVHVGLAHRQSPAISRHFLFPGERSVIRDRSAKAALQMLRFALMNESTASMIWEVLPKVAAPATSGAGA